MLGALQSPIARPYDVEADWTLLEGCNYRCGYCFLTAEALSSQIRALATPEEWRVAFDATGRTWLLHITGGEPTAYPGFAALCRALTERHYVSINTNLSLDTVLSFVGTIDPERVHYFHASYHPAERDRKKGVDGFVRRAASLRDAGFTVFLTVVATPEVLANFDEVVAPIREAGLPIAPKILRGTLGGRRFPHVYSQEDKARFRAASAAGRKAYGKLLSDIDEPPTINVFNDAAYLDGVPSFHGRHCDAGYRFVAIDPKGTVVRCGASTDLGNILARSLHLWDEGRACNSTHCMYFCEKYAEPAPHVVPEFIAALPGWVQRLVSQQRHRRDRRAYYQRRTNDKAERQDS
jgi:MoaA/NifB/PqqE/SkfB family radical SAM enzyme